MQRLCQVLGFRSLHMQAVAQFRDVLVSRVDVLKSSHLIRCEIANMLSKPGYLCEKFFPVDTRHVEVLKGILDCCCVCSRCDRLGLCFGLRWFEIAVGLASAFSMHRNDVSQQSVLVGNAANEARFDDARFKGARLGQHLIAQLVYLLRNSAGVPVN